MEFHVSKILLKGDFLYLFLGYNPPEPAAPGSSGALSGLVSQYGHSDEEDSDDSQDKVTAAPAKGKLSLQGE